MPFVDAQGLPGKVYVPENAENTEKKHSCPECYCCQFCDDNRCEICLKQQFCGKGS